MISERGAGREPARAIKAHAMYINAYVYIQTSSNNKIKKGGPLIMKIDNIQIFDSANERRCGYDYDNMNAFSMVATTTNTLNTK